MDVGRERNLVERCRRGDEGAFQELVEEHRSLVFALIARVIPDRSRTEDAAQDVFLRMYRGLPYFRGESRLSTWIYRIVANVCAQEAADASTARAGSPSDSMEWAMQALRAIRSPRRCSPTASP